MKIQMRKITQTPKHFNIIAEKIALEGEVSRINSKIFSVKARLKGEMMLSCDMSGECFCKEFDEPLVLYISDGLWDVQSQKPKLDNFDVIEFFDGFIDLKRILESEIESIKSDYHIKKTGV